MKRLLLIFLAGILLTCQPLQDPGSSALTIGTPKAAGFSPARLARIDASLQDWVDKGWINGAVGLIARNGKIVYYKGVGYNDIETKEVLDKEGIFQDRLSNQSYHQRGRHDAVRGRKISAG
ncbi:MAG: hypothetical protein RIE59_24810 [Imperialibacter sp.]